MRALSLTVCTAVRTQSQDTTVCPALLATQDPNHLAKVLSKLLLTNRQVHTWCFCQGESRMFINLYKLFLVIVNDCPDIVLLHQARVT